MTYADNVNVGKEGRAKMRSNKKSNVLNWAKSYGKAWSEEKASSEEVHYCNFSFEEQTSKCFDENHEEIRELRGTDLNLAFFRS